VSHRRDAIEDAVRHGNDFLFVHGNALDAVSGMLGKKVASCSLLVWMSARNSYNDE